MFLGSIDDCQVVSPWVQYSGHSPLSPHAPDSPHGTIPGHKLIEYIVALMIHPCRVIPPPPGQLMFPPEGKHQASGLKMCTNLQISNYGVILSILAAHHPPKDIPHCSSTLPAACELFKRPLGPPGTMIWAAEGGSRDDDERIR